MHDILFTLRSFCLRYLSQGSRLRGVRLEVNVKLERVDIIGLAWHLWPHCVSRVGGDGWSLSSSSNRAAERVLPVRKTSFAGVLRISRKPFWRSHKSRSIRSLCPPLLPPSNTQTRGSLNPIGPIAISSKWLSRELNRIGFQRWFSLGAFVAIDMGLLSVFASLKLQLFCCTTWTVLAFHAWCIDSDVDGKFKRMLPNFLSFMIS